MQNFGNRDCVYAAHHGASYRGSGRGGEDVFFKRILFRSGSLLTVRAFVAATPAETTETVTDSYDMLGWLMQSPTTSSVNNGLVAVASYAAADNRASYALTGSANFSPPVQVVVPPPAGFTSIPLNSIVQ
jgi:hypothetical protein